MPTLLMDWVEVEGPITTEATRKKRFGILPNNAHSIGPKWDFSGT